jgi:gas vesicle protein
METSNTIGKQIVGLLVGAAIGTTLGVLFAPNKGSRTRGRISTRAKYIARNVKKKFSNEVDMMAEKAERMGEEVEATVDELTNSKKKK